MNTGIGFSEFILVVLLILVFFGSKELPNFLKKAAQMLATVRRYSNRVKSELNSITNPIDLQSDSFVNVQSDKKNELRKKHRIARKSIDRVTRTEKTAAVHTHLKSTDEYKAASTVMIYHSTGSELSTIELINDMLSEGKRVILPYCTPPSYELGISEIKDLQNDCVPGEFNIPEPAPSLRKKFLRSDLDLIICPGVAFDRYGGRLGNGKGCYDRFITELRGKIPIYALAFDCQITSETLPFEYHDVPMDQIITESGFLLPPVKKFGYPSTVEKETV
ncbi:MAG TPA: 5-formyltetrahydrofolate cyclo-ligase [Chitinispirillaceae bacterium]|nr:5-formyltetrahydrofolate cyclo-ligase [Chitinispirillaceae bacterium]